MAGIIIAKNLTLAQRQAARDHTRTGLTRLSAFWSAEIPRWTDERLREMVQTEALDEVFHLVRDQGHDDILATSPKEDGFEAVVKHVFDELDRMDLNLST